MTTTPREEGQKIPRMEFNQRLDELAGDYARTYDPSTYTEMLDLCVQAFQEAETPQDAKSLWIQINLTCLPIQVKRRIADIATAAIFEPAERKKDDPVVTDATFSIRRKLKEGMTPQDAGRLIALQNGGVVQPSKRWNPRQVLG